MKIIDVKKVDRQYLERLLRHIELVQQNCILIGKQLIENGKDEDGRMLIKNGLTHDNSKFSGIEWEYLKLYEIKRLNKNQKWGLTTAITEHTLRNPHHPEFWMNIQNMPEIYIAEMVCDWKARSMEFGTDLRKWIEEEATKRYDFKKDDTVGNMVFKYVDMICSPSFELQGK